LQPIALTRPALPRSATSLGPFALFERWIAAAKPAGSTVNRWRAVFLNLQGRFGEQRITENDARGWANGLITDDRTAVTVHDIWLSSAKSVYAWAVENKFTDSNPFAAVKITVPRKVVTRDRAFTPAEAKTILAAASAIEPKSAFTAAQRWCPWLAGYSGARMGEITQLRGADVKQIDGVWCLELSPEAGTIKSGTFRRVPIHEHLIEQGFLKFVEAHHAGPLFYVADGKAKDEDISNPIRPRAVKTRERLAAWTRALGVTDKGIAPNHAWRHLWKTIAARAGISDSLSDSITGHASPTVAGRYLHPTVEDMAAALRKFPRYDCACAS
jgi:integrase